MNLGQFWEALEDLDQAILLDPERGSAYYNRSLANTETGRDAQASADKDKACSLDDQFC